MDLRTTWITIFIFDLEEFLSDDRPHPLWFREDITEICDKDLFFFEFIFDLFLFEASEFLKLHFEDRCCLFFTECEILHQVRMRLFFGF